MAQLAVPVSHMEMADTQIAHPRLEREGWEIMGEVQRSDRDEGNSAEKKDRRERKIREHHMMVSRIPENPVESREHCRNKGA